MPKVTVAEKVTREVDYVPCLKCGGLEVIFFDHGYTQGNSGGGKCKSCGNECTSSLQWDAKTDQQVAVWNAQNDPAKLIEAQNKIILAAQNRIQEITAQSAAIAVAVAA